MVDELKLHSRYAKIARFEFQVVSTIQTTFVRIFPKKYVCVCNLRVRKFHINLMIIGIISDAHKSTQFYHPKQRPKFVFIFLCPANEHFIPKFVHIFPHRRTSYFIYSQKVLILFSDDGSKCLGNYLTAHKNKQKRTHSAE